ncbi:uncharacterized protein [Blastocystis hominis]|uniref:Rab-GAP TBC domain-containing protein n=1 Tax=Blastocystis hominis TaxID=12968 RepID=D8M6P1_BLAHO|nr:uncharacterized protein [Blastocystis hominis]CBK23459.2 unnamed protein product [Blastocystis hominis]|eukprot:XP_012897507.1 uncharacterized protein [Blastocystis hominis]
MFPRMMGYLVLEKQYELSHSALLADRETRWKSFLARIGGVESLSFKLTRQSGNRWKIFNVTQEDRNRQELRGLIHEGVPEHLRGDVWYYVSGANEMAQASANSYHELCQMEVDEAVKRMIALDIPRTFANNSLFHAEQDRPAPYADMLRSILYATSQRRTDVKYCQGLNYIAALLLLVQHDEEKAFWTLQAIMEHLFSKDYFNEQLAGARVDQKVLEMLVQQQIPDLQKRLREGGFELVMFTLPWFICLFINTLPFITVMRVWDVIMFEGDKALIRIALALLSIGERELRGCTEFSEFSNTFKQLGALLFDADNLLDVAYQKKIAEGASEKVIFFRRKELAKWREEMRSTL